MTIMPPRQSLLDFLPDYIQPTVARSPINKAKMAGLDPQAMRALGDPTALANQLGVAEGPTRKPLSKFQQMKDQFFGVPEALRGLLSPEDLEGAQKQGMLSLGLSLLGDSGPKTADQVVTPMQSIGRALEAARGGHMGSLQNAAAMQGAAVDMQGKQKELERVKGLEQGRQAIIKRYPMPPQGNPDAMAQWIDQVLPHFIEIQDEETVARLSEIRKSLGGQQARQREPGQFMEVPGPDGKPRTVYVTPSQIPEGGVPTYERPQRDTEDALTINSRILREQGLTKQYDQSIKGVEETVNAFMSAKQAEKMGGAGDLQILYSFITALDPESVVREGEISLARQAASLWSQAHILKNKFENEGGVLSPVMRSQMIELMEKMVTMKTKRADLAIKDTKDRASRFGLTVNLYDPLESYRNWKSEQSNPAPAPGANPASNVVPRQPGEKVADYLKRTRKQ